MTCRTFFSAGYSEYVMFTRAALEHMYLHVQHSRCAKEAGGELFARVFDASCVVIDSASGPHLSDKRSRYSFLPDVDAGAKERLLQWEQGLHAVGLWHTHPECVPTPSGPDRRTTEQYLRAFDGERARYFSVILGNRGAHPVMTVLSVSNRGWTPWVEAGE
ncbi:Mov34/MPN/PAD-1 family protein [Burkholderia gladioli]|nr:Mov34/MPN/PAD-1 family protein [Burkholderia gladioli]